MLLNESALSDDKREKRPCFSPDPFNERSKLNSLSLPNDEFLCSM